MLQETWFLSVAVDELLVFFTHQLFGISVFYPEFTHVLQICIEFADVELASGADRPV